MGPGSRAPIISEAELPAAGQPTRERSQIRPRTIWTVALHLLLIWACLTILAGAREVISWILVSLFLALSLDPAVRFLEKYRLRRSLAVAVVTLAALGLIALLVGTLVPMLIEQGRSLAESAPRLLERLRGSSLVASLDSRLDIIERAQREVGGRLGAATGPLVRVVGSLLHSVAAVVTVVVLTVFMLLFGGGLFRSALGWVPAARREQATATVARVRRAVGGYVSGTLLIALIGGAVTTILLLALGVPYFLPLGLAVTLLGVIPFLGAALGGFLVVATTFLSSGSQKGLIALGVFLVYQQVENHLLQPLVQRRTIQMNPLAIAIVMLVGTAFAGVLGALLALPLAAAVHIVLSDVRTGRDQPLRQI